MNYVCVLGLYDFRLGHVPLTEESPEGNWSDLITDHILWNWKSHTFAWKLYMEIYGGFHSHGGTPIAGCFGMENPTEIDALGVSWGIYILCNHHISSNCFCSIHQRSTANFTDFIHLVKTQNMPTHPGWARSGSTEGGSPCFYPTVWLGWPGFMVDMSRLRWVFKPPCKHLSAVGPCDIDTVPCGSLQPWHFFYASMRRIKLGCSSIIQ